jgi:hypothetical protein
MSEASVSTILKAVSVGIPQTWKRSDMSLDLFNKRGVSFCPRRRIILQPVKQGFAILPQILVEVSNIIQ